MKAKQGLYVEQYATDEIAVCSYTVVKAVNMTAIHIGDQLTKETLNSLIQDGVTITITYPK